MAVPLSFFLSLFHGSLLTVCQNENENLIKQALLVFWNELNEHSNRVYFASFFSLILLFDSLPVMMSSMDMTSSTRLGMSTPTSSDDNSCGCCSITDDCCCSSDSASCCCFDKYYDHNSDRQASSTKLSKSRFYKEAGARSLSFFVSNL